MTPNSNHLVLVATPEEATEPELTIQVASGSNVVREDAMDRDVMSTERTHSRQLAVERLGKLLRAWPEDF